MKKSFLLAVLCALLFGCVSAQAAYTNTRDDGVWLFPLSSGYYNSFTDWAGCPGYSNCPFCGVPHSSWGDGYHGGDNKGHNGVDIGAGNGVAVKAAAGGTLYTTGVNYSARGIIAVVEHPLGNGRSYYSVYQHLSSAKTNLNGTKVAAGDTIGAVGGTGGSSNNDYGYHLHFEILLADSGKGADLSRTSGLWSIENGGWFSKVGSVSDDGYSYGRINNNPSLTSPAGFPTGQSGVVPPLKYHAGSVRYTFNASEVDIYTSSGNNPTVCVDTCEGGEGTIYLRGWAFDRDDYSSPVMLHVYVGGPDNTTGVGYQVLANTYRPDVHAAYGCGENHGFDTEIDVSVFGDAVDVYVYGINSIGGGSNFLKEKYTVKITAPALGKLEWKDMASTYCESEEVKFTWESVENATDYALLIRKYDASVGGYIVYEEIEDAESGVGRKLPAGKYRVRLTASNSAESSSTMHSFTVYGIPGTPKLKNMASTYKENEAVTFTWDAAANAEYYVVAISKLEGEESTLYDYISNAESGVSRTLPVGEYKVRLYARNEEYSTPSDSVYFTVYGEPGKPTLKTAKSVYTENETVTFTWDAVENAESYRLEILTDEYYWFNSFDVAGNSFTMTLPEGKYIAMLYATNPQYSTLSNWVRFTVKPEALLSATANTVNDHIVLFVKSKQEITTQILHIALYSEAGQMLDYIIVPTVEPFMTTNVVFDDDVAVKTAKVFLWDSLTTTTPIADAVEVAVR